MKSSKLSIFLISLSVFSFLLPNVALGQEYDDYQIITHSKEALQKLGRSIDAPKMEIQTSAEKGRVLVINVTGRRTLLMEIAYKAFLAGASVIKDAKNPINEIVVIASAQYKNVETFYFSSTAACSIDLFHRLISIEKFTSDCININ